jgi:hypothetical protein
MTKKPVLQEPHWLFLFLFFNGRGLHLAHGAGLAAGRALLGLTAGFHLIAALFTGKNGHDYHLQKKKGSIAGILIAKSFFSLPPLPDPLPQRGERYKRKELGAMAIIVGAGIWPTPVRGAAGAEENFPAQAPCSVSIRKLLKISPLTKGGREYFSNSLKIPLNPPLGKGDFEVRFPAKNLSG